MALRYFRNRISGRPVCGGFRCGTSVSVAGVAAASVFTLVSSVSAGGVPNAFTQEAIPRGLVYVMQQHLGSYGWFGFGAGFSDLDGDGDSDVIIMGNTAGTVGIFENIGGGMFVDRSGVANLPVLPEGSAFAAGDYNGDGLNDIYLTQIGPTNYLMRNDGGFAFTDVTATAAVGDTGAGKGASWGDFDNDGWLDLYVSNYSTTGSIPGDNEFNKLYRNNGDGTFADVSVAQTVADDGQGFESIWTDYDRDGDVDLYLSNDNRPPGPYRPNQLWRNDNGTLVNVSVESGADVQLFSMGIAAGDFDRNGWPDYYFTNIPEGFGIDNPLMLNQGDGTFIENGVAAGVENNKTSWGAIFWDFDNDTDIDLYVNNMWELNAFFVNFSGWPYFNFASVCAVQSTANVSFCSSIADVDGDGALDLLLNDMNINVQLFMNNEGQNRNWIRFRMLGPYPNRYAVGGNASVYNGSLEQFHEIYAGGNGFLGQNELTMHFGLDDETVAETVIARWPGGAIERQLTNYPANVEWTLYPPAELGDPTGDGMVLFDDFATLAACYGNPVALGCEIMDFNGDAVIDDIDRDAFIAAYDGIVEDCDLNGTTDLADILANPALDGDGNGRIDSCEQPAPCPGDCAPDNGDGTFGNQVINIDDLLTVINSFGTVGPSPCDAAPDNGDGTYGNNIVNIDDLLAVINSFGACP